MANTCVADGAPTAIDEHDSSSVTLPAGIYLPMFFGITDVVSNNYQKVELDVKAGGEFLSLYSRGGRSEATFFPFTLFVPTQIFIHASASMIFDCGGPLIYGQVGFLKVG